MKGVVIMAVCAVCAANPVVGEENPSIAWILAQTGTPLVVQKVGQMAVRGTEMISVDSLTYSPEYPWPWFTVPEGPARVVVFDDPQEYALSKAMILFSDAVPVCGEEVGVMPVDTGTGAFLDRPTAEELARISLAMGTDCNLYDCLMAEQMGDAQFAKMIRLPDGTGFPAFSTGAGDGTYPVFLLYDADSAPVAAYADFLGVSPSYEWLTPPACLKPVS
jgi:hypothetical protein